MCQIKNYIKQKLGWYHLKTIWYHIKTRKKKENDCNELVKARNLKVIHSFQSRDCFVFLISLFIENQGGGVRILKVVLLIFSLDFKTMLTKHFKKTPVYFNWNFLTYWSAIY